MAKAIMTQILEGQIETIHRGNEWTYTLPEHYTDLSKDILMDKDKLVAFLNSKGLLLQMLHAGYQNDIIACRAKGRPADKDGEPTVLTEQVAIELQKRILEHKPNLLPDPSEVKTTKSTSKALDEAGRKMAISFAQAGTTWEMASSIMSGAGFPADKYKEIFDRALEG